LITLPHLKTKARLAESLGVSEAKASQAIEFLQKIGLLIATKQGYQIGTRHVHLSADSLLIAKHHTNWRFHAIQSLESATSEDLHYSGAVSLSKAAALTIRENLLKVFQENMRLVRDAKEEVAYVYNFDFYRLDK
jgi:DNA-binding IclR family transcriptional regulator